MDQGQDGSVALRSGQRIGRANAYLRISSFELPDQWRHRELLSVCDGFFFFEKRPKGLRDGTAYSGIFIVEERDEPGNARFDLGVRQERDSPQSDAGVTDLGVPV